MNRPRRHAVRPFAALAPNARWPLLAAVVAALLGGPVRADDEADAAEQRRQAIESAHQQAMRDCNARFVSSACLDAAAVQRRDALAEWRRQRALRDEERRRRRAADRLQSVERKNRETEARGLLAWPGPSVPARAARATASAPSTVDGAARAAIPLEAPPSRASRPAAAASAASGRSRPNGSDGRIDADADSRAAEFRRREQAAEAHRRAVQQRNAAQDARRAPGAGLPLPKDGSAADPQRPDPPGAGGIR